MENIKSRDWKYIEECIALIGKGEDESEVFLRISRALSRIFDIEFQIILTNNNTSEFFGVNVFPIMDNIDNITHMIINDKAPIDRVVEAWQTSKNWTLEIDSFIVTDISKSFSPAEVTSLILYEIMRTIYSNVIPTMVNNLFRYEYMKFTSEMRSLFENDKIRKILDLVFVEACITKNFAYINDGDKLKLCQDTVCKFGYKEDFNNAVNKIVKYFSTEFVNKTESEIKRDLNLVVQWAINNIRQLECTKADLRDALKTEILKSNSTVVQMFINCVYDTFFTGVISQYRVLLSEQVSSTPGDKLADIQAMDNLMGLYRKIVKESFNRVFDKNGKLRKISQLDIDILTVDAGRIDTADDKIYLLDRIYDALQTVEAGLNYLDSPDKSGKVKVSQSKATLLDMQKQLQRLREQVLATRIVEKEYGVYIKYPKGYEH